ncbi:TPA: LTA synthase family protein, partial [Escherichia coli]
PKELIGAILNFIWRSSPILFIYLLFRIINIPIFLCSYLSGIAIITLMFVNSTKMALTGEPLSFNDIVSGFNLSVAGKYLNLSSITYSVAILIGAIISILLS